MPADDLTPRQLEALIYLGNGYSLADTAAAMEITVQSLKNHLGVAYRVLGARNRFQAFMELGWLTPPALPR